MQDNRDAAGRFLRRELAHQPRKFNDLLASARSERISRRALLEAARSVGVKRYRTGNQADSEWIWQLATDARAASSNLPERISAVVVVVALMVGISLRLAKLGTVPSALDQDEVCEGYDAYSILLTGHDQHGNFLPLEFQSFNDYRMPLFQYSLVPLIEAFGLRPATVQLGAAVWGSADLIAMTIVGWLMLGGPGAAAVALFGALSPWHLTVSRYGHEAITASTTITLAMMCFFLWLRRRRGLWLVGCGVLFGISLYSYSITKAFAPLMIVSLVVLYWRELRQAQTAAVWAALTLAALALPQIELLLTRTAEMQAQYQHLSLFHVIATCPRCDPAQASLVGHSLLYQLIGFAANWASYFTPAFLFLVGDRGDHWTLLHPPGFGQLLPEQAPLILLALIALMSARWRRLTALLACWLLFAALPAALIMPLGASWPEPTPLPTPHVMFDYSVPAAPLTPALLLSHPDSRHGVLAMVPWTLLSAVGFVVLLELCSQTPVLQAVAVGVIAAATIFSGGRFVTFYFRDYSAIAAPYFQYGVEQALAAVRRLDDGVQPIVITPRINQPYIYVLFFDRYPPAYFQRARVVRAGGLFGPVLGFDRYIFVDPQLALSKLAHGLFVLAPNDKLPSAPAESIRYPDGSVAYNVVVK
ncbi:MAG TPA: hypothetical protein VEJ86_10545 [Candidatus Binataceae bacterium]|nr:hypothetical protein [Candidatus Binataceae bacterium]